MRVLAAVPGPSGHGVVRHGLAVAGLVAGRGADVTVLRDLDPPRAGHDLTHVQFTDALFGADIAAAAGAFVAWARTAPRPLVVTLHDVPGRDADPERDRRRRAGYRRVIAAADAVVVSAAHEADGARAAGASDPVVVPLPVEPLAPPGPRPAWADRPSVAVLGFVYPGKGHAEVLRGGGGGRSRAGPGGGAGRPAARPRGRSWSSCGARRSGSASTCIVTGTLSDADLHAAVLAATVPVAAYRTIGASGSLAPGWPAAGGRS